ncbi:MULTISPECIES: hypothetical protein [unclassified Fusibacter]|uniref:hypothetical protein n=1 Tax=unclassified Fusibacter TaxID=2624464 RepID=UPI0010135A77|nr:MULTISPECIES: hypothetical protein [unclassified Fusibacter]MCK8058962.1 hypothetical protein [Fusibacter sp. A2]NPE22039.1 hypothetical protein [Fusibacter sp. A1]RXV61603.1 hypothetical protein DWB64_09350 [Fusibacter sp. A1]
MSKNVRLVVLLLCLLSVVTSYLSFSLYQDSRLYKQTSTELKQRILELEESLNKVEAENLSEKSAHRYSDGYLAYTNDILDMHNGTKYIKLKHDNSCVIWKTTRSEKPLEVFSKRNDNFFDFSVNKNESVMVVVFDQEIYVVDLTSSDFDYDKYDTTQFNIESFGSYSDFYVNDEGGRLTCVPDRHPMNVYQWDKVAILDIEEQSISLISIPDQFGSEVVFNAESNWIVYSSYPQFSDVDDYEHFLKQPYTINLYAWNLITNRLLMVDRHYGMKFEPVIYSENQLSFRSGNKIRRVTLNEDLQVVGMDSGNYLSLGKYFDDISNVEIGLGMTVRELEEALNVEHDQVSFDFFWGAHYGIIGSFSFLSEFNREIDEQDSIIITLFYRGDEPLFGVRKGMKLGEVEAVLGKPMKLSILEYDELYQGYKAEYLIGDFDILLLLDDSFAVISYVISDIKGHQTYPDWELPAQHTTWNNDMVIGVDEEVTLKGKTNSLEHVKNATNDFAATAGDEAGLYQLIDRDYSLIAQGEFNQLEQIRNTLFYNRYDDESGFYQYDIDQQSFKRMSSEHFRLLYEDEQEVQGLLLHLDSGRLYSIDLKSGVITRVSDLNYLDYFSFRHDASLSFFSPY